MLNKNLICYCFQHKIQTPYLTYKDHSLPSATACLFNFFIHSSLPFIHHLANITLLLILLRSPHLSWPHAITIASSKLLLVGTFQGCSSTGSSNVTFSGRLLPTDYHIFSFTSSTAFIISCYLFYLFTCCCKRRVSLVRSTMADTARASASKTDAPRNCTRDIY